VPADVLAQLGHRVQHALRAFTPNDQKALTATAKTFPRSDFYDIEEVLTTLGIGEAMVTVLSAKGVPSQPFATRLIPPASRMGPLTDAELQQRVGSSAQVRKYRDPVNPLSAEEKLRGAVSSGAGAGADAPSRPSTLEEVLNSRVGRSVARTVAVTVAGALTRGLMGALLGKRRRY